MPNRTQDRLQMGKVGRRVIEAAFDGGDIASDGGVTLLKLTDERLGLTRAAAQALGDERRGASVKHDLRSLLAQRVYGLCCGWEDLSDHTALRKDLVWQTALGRDQPLASAPTLSRLDNAGTPQSAWALHGVLLDQFIASCKSAPTELVLDVDATHVPLHGQQERAHFNAHYDTYCYLPLYVFCGQDLLACVLRPSSRDPASIVSAVLKLLVRRLRQAWPQVRLIVRADSGFSRPRVLHRLEKWGVDYVLGLQKNPVLQAQCEYAALELKHRHESSQNKERLIGEFTYAARSWSRERRVIARLEHGAQGADARFIVTTLSEPADQMYEQRYCGRGEAENRIKEAQLDLFGRRGSCHRYAGNQMRLLLAALAYTLMINLRRLALHGSELAQACGATIRTKLLKIGAAVLRNTRRVRLMLASQHPLRELFATAVGRLTAPS